MSVCLIYAYWPNRPFGMNWCDLPLALREAGLPEQLHKAGHDVVEMTLFTEGDEGEELAGGFQLARDIGGAIDVAREAGDLPVVLCGSCALAAVGVAASELGGSDTGTVWCDAHPDLNTPETSTSGLFEGMALAAACGRAWQGMATDIAGAKPLSLDHTVLFGAREIDSGEAVLIEAEKIPVADTVSGVNSRLSGTTHAYVHLDMDVHDALQVRSNRFAVPDGPSIDAVRDILTHVDHLAVLAVTGLDSSADGAKEALKVAIDHVHAVADAWKDGRYVT